MPSSSSPNVETVGNYLVIVIPDNYATPGTSGRQDIVCTSLSDGGICYHYNAIESELSTVITRNNFR